MGIPVSKLRDTFAEYNDAWKNPEDTKKNRWGKKYFNSMAWDANDKFMVAQITPVVHYCMGGVAANEFSEVVTPNGKVITALFVAGEAQGGVHGVNRLGGSSLLDCVVYGRISGRSATKFLLDKILKNPGAAAGGLSKSVGGIAATVRVQPGGKVLLELDAVGVSGGVSDANVSAAPTSTNAAGFQEEDPNAAFYGKGFATKTGTAPAAAAPAASNKKSFSVDEVKKHNKDSDCWVILHGEVYDVTKFLNDHPGGKKAIMLYAGKDATTEFDMLHSKDLLARYGPEFHIGVVQGGAKL